MIKGLVVGHKNIGEGLLKALKSVSGSFEDIIFISNEGLSTDEIAKNISDTYNKGEAILFVDLYGGSCWQAAKKSLKPGCHIVTGVNLPMLLSFINKRETLSSEDLRSVLENDGKRGIVSE